MNGAHNVVAGWLGQSISPRGESKPRRRPYRKTNAKRRRYANHEARRRAAQTGEFMPGLTDAERARFRETYSKLAA